MSGRIKDQAARRGVVAKTATLLGAMLCVVGASGGAALAGQAESRGKDKTPVALSVRPGQLQVMAVPCDVSTMDVVIENESSAPAYVEVFVTPEAPLGVSREVIASYLPAGYEQVVPVEVSAPETAVGGEYEILLETGRTGKRESVTVPVTVETRPEGPGANLAFGGPVSASSAHSNMDVCGGVDGNRDSSEWGGSGWHDGTRYEFPDWYQVDFSEPQRVGRVDLYTLDSVRYPAAEMGLRDYDVQVLEDGEWRTVDSVRDNTEGLVRSTFAPVAVDAVRVVSLDSNDGKYSRIVELEVYGE